MIIKNKISFGTIARLGLLFALLFFVIASPAQSENSPPAKKKKARISLNYFKINDLERKLVATVKTKVERSYQNVSGVKVNFYRESTDEKNRLGAETTLENGEATFVLPENMEPFLDTLFQYNFVAAIENDERFKDKEKELSISESVFEMVFEEKDSVKWVRVFLARPDSTGKVVPVEEAEPRVYVKRLFGLLPVAEEFETTDEEGMLSVKFPDDIPGNSTGNLTIVVKIDDSDEFGNLEVSKISNWGVPLVSDAEEETRNLWASRANAPLYLIFSVSTTVVGIWGVIFYIIFQLFKIKRIGGSLRQHLET